MITSNARNKQKLNYTLSSVIFHHDHTLFSTIYCQKVCAHLSRIHYETASDLWSTLQFKSIFKLRNLMKRFCLHL